MIITTFLTEGAPAPLGVVPDFVVDPFDGEFPFFFSGFASGDTAALGLGEDGDCSSVAADGSETGSSGALSTASPAGVSTSPPLA